MKLIQKSVTNVSRSIVSINDETFVELLGVNNNTMNFRFMCRVSTTNAFKKIRDYDRIRLTVYRSDKDVSSANATSPNTTITQTNLAQTSKAIVNPNPLKFSAYQPSSANANAPTYTKKVLDKLTIGKTMIHLHNAKDDFLVQRVVSLSDFVSDFNFHVTELQVPEHKIVPDHRDNGAALDIKNLVFRMNEELTVPTSIAELAGRVTSNYDTSDNGLTLTSYVVSKDFGRMNYDVLRYALLTVPPSPDSTLMTWYEAKETTKKLDYIEVPIDASIMIGNSNTSLDVKFEIFKATSSDPDESITKTFNTTPHLDAYFAVSIPPVVSVHHGRSQTSANSFTISIDDHANTGKVSGYNVYMKSIDRTGSAGSYKLIKTFSGLSTTFTHPMTDNLSVIRVVPIENNRAESSTFTDVVVGSGHDAMGRLTIVPSTDGKTVVVDVFNIPKGVSLLSLVARNDCDRDPSAPFKKIDAIKPTQKSSSARFNVAPASSRTLSEYVVIADYQHETKDVSRTLMSNYAFFRQPDLSSLTRDVSVSLTDGQFSSDAGGSLNISFNLKTNVPESERTRITNALKAQLGDLYDQFVSPANNSSSPFGDGQKFTDLFMHEIVRTNLNTSERETFALVGDGTFTDDRTSRKVSKVRPLNPQHAYIYQVFTFKRDPMTLFQRYVAYGTDRNGKEWFYRPIKWKTPRVLASGALYPDDKDGVPLIDPYESITSDPCGMTASYRYDGTSDVVEVTKVVADRIDRNTVKVSWEFKDSSFSGSAIRYYDSFLVMKEVNGVRSFVGRAKTNHIYHELTSKDLGNVYYIVLPIMSEFDIDNPAYSRPIYISPDGLTTKTMLIQHSNVR